MRGRRLTRGVLVLAVAALALVVSGAGVASHAATPYKVAWIYVGPHNDGGWSQAHDDGRLYVQKMLGSKVQTTYKENIAVGSQFAQTVQSLVSQGYKMIFATSYGYVDKALAAKYPDVLFEQATGTDQAKNLSEYFGAAEDTVFLSGMAAGAASKNGNIGYVVAYPIPEVIRHANAFTLGAQLMHPGAKVHLVWTNSWYDPTKEKKAAQSLVSQGADVLGQNVDSPATGQYAESANVGWVGYDSNSQKFAPKAVADRLGLQLGTVLPEPRQGRDGRHVEVGLLLRLDQGRVHRSGAVRAGGEREDEGRDRGEDERDREGLVLRVHGPAVRPEREADGQAGREAVRPAAVRDELARQGRGRQPEGLAVTSEPAAGAAATATPTGVAVAMHGISKRFPGVVANDAVDFEVAAGEVHALLGENGAGKSTLSNILTGLYRPDEGEILLYGERVEFETPRDALDAGIGMVHQHFRLVPPFTVAENIALGDHRPGARSSFRIDPRRIEAGVRELSDRYGIAVDPRARIWQLSLGEQQRVEILKALYRDARVLILDEPTAVLTPQEADVLFRTLRQMADDGRTVIFISHKLNEVKAVSDRVTVLRGGRSVATASTAESTPRSLAALMVGRELGESAREARPAPTGPMLEVEQVWAVGNRGGDAVRGVSLSVRAGEVVGVAGVAGNGQRELAETIAGLRGASSGTVTVGGNRVRGGDPRASMNAGIAFVPEDRLATGAAPGLSIASNLVLRSYRKPPISRGPLLMLGQIRRRAVELIERYRISAPGPSAPARVLSGGNLQKVVIAREFSGEPRVVIASSPTQGLDVGATETVRCVPARRGGPGRGGARLQRGPRRDPRARRSHRRDLRGRDRRRDAGRPREHRGDRAADGRRARARQGRLTMALNRRSRGTRSAERPPRG